MKIHVVIKRPDSAPYATNIENTLENLQRTVGGYIETYGVAGDMTIICNEEGRIRHLPYNCRVCGMDFYGTIIFAGVDVDAEDFCDIPCTFKEFKQMFRED